MAIAVFAARSPLATDKRRGNLPRLSSLSLPPTLTSRPRGWPGFCADLHDWPSGGDFTSPAHEDDIIAVRLSGTVWLRQERHGLVDERLATVGNVTVHPRAFESVWTWDRPGAILIMRMATRLLLEAAEATTISPPPTTRLRNCFGVRDPFVEHIAGLFAAELATPAHPAQPLIAETLACALAGHLVHRFERRATRAAGDVGKLEGRVVRRVVEYITEHVGEPITLDQLARLAAVSRFHFARAFKRTIGTSPMAYVERARLERARQLVERGDLPLAEIAAAVGYTDQSHFTRRFRRAFGCTPGQLARARRSGTTA